MDQKPTLPSAKQMVPQLLEALRELAGPASVAELEVAVAQKMGLSEQQLAIPHDKSRSEFQYRLAWSRSYAKRDGLVESPKRNQWQLPVS